MGGKFYIFCDRDNADIYYYRKIGFIEKMRIFDRYIIKNFLWPFAYCLFLFMFLYTIADIFSNLDEILRNKVSLPILLQYYGAFIPIIFVQTTPIAALLANVYMLSAFNKNNELTAARACGVSLKQLLLPVFIVGLMLGLLIFIVNEIGVPRGIVTVERIKSEFIKVGYSGPKDVNIVRNLTFYGKEKQLVYAQEFDAENNILDGIIIIERNQHNVLRRKILASKAAWVDDKWVFDNCIIYEFDELGKSAGNPMVFKEKIIKFLDTPEQLQRYEFQPEYMSYRELKNYIDRLSDSNPRILNSMKTNLYFKTAIPFITIIIMLLGIPFAVSTRRGGAMAGVGISILIGLIYYGSIYFILAMGKGGLLHPFVAAHLPNILFLIIAFGLLKRSL
jgi:lipopolysaccharide export system permease protein